jgi:nitrite reductase/ring-hydroxylating ferredoxin subunit/DMSO/TMAO reductase YedYZ heme-binding membrane subunit
VTKLRFPLITDEILLMRAFGVAAFLLLHIILCIGPICRLNTRFLPLLYNRRHAGVTMTLLSLVHAVLVVATYHAGSDTNPILSIFISDSSRGSPLGIPFQPLGFVALVILLLMAATSHDFWLANLTAPVWKTLHMLVYVAYALLVLHVALGVLQAEGSPVHVVATAIGFVAVLGLHIVAGSKERLSDRALEEPNVSQLRTCAFPSPRPSPSRGGRIESSARANRSASNSNDTGECDSLSPRERVGARGNEAHEFPDAAEHANAGFIDVCHIDQIREGRARIVCMSGERVAIFRYDGKISAVSNVCQHQNGPLGEGRVIDGCITCPWHGYQYVPDTGASPPPFSEKVPTFNVQVKSGRVFIHPKPNPAGTRAEPALVEQSLTAVNAMA